MANKRQMRMQHDLVRTLAVRYLELSERNIESRDDNGHGSTGVR